MKLIESHAAALGVVCAPVKQGGRSGRLALVLEAAAHAFLWALSRAEKELAPLLLLSACVLLPSASEAQTPDLREPPAQAGRWQWAKSDQTELRIVALDAQRKQVVTRIGGGELAILRRGASVPSLGVFLADVTGNAAVFLPMDVPGKESVEHIKVELVNGGQVTSSALVTAPARSVVEGWKAESP